MRAAHTEEHERSCPRAPLINNVLAAEVPMKLIECHALTRNRWSDILRVDIGILPCPAYFDQAIFLDAHTERNSIARARVEYDARVRPCDMGLNGEAHAGAITGEWSEIKSQWFWLRWL